MGPPPVEGPVGEARILSAAIGAAGCVRKVGAAPPFRDLGAHTRKSNGSSTPRGQTGNELFNRIRHKATINCRQFSPRTKADRSDGASSFPPHFQWYEQQASCPHVCIGLELLGNSSVGHQFRSGTLGIPVSTLS